MKNTLTSINRSRSGVYRYLYIGWTCAVLISVAWNLYFIHSQTIEQARIEARTIFAHNLAYRKWNTQHGGVYVKMKDGTSSNLYLDVDDRDITTVDGIKLTLINPFQMTREAYSLLVQETPLPIYNRTVSTSYLNPLNEPDAWEEKALDAFERGHKEISEINMIRNEPYMRLIRPYITYKGCLKCHGFQGYEAGDIRGGMSISVPMKPYLAQEAASRVTVVMTHFMLWLLGLGSLMLLIRNIERSQNRIATSEKKFRVLAETTTDWEYWVSDDEGIVFMSPSCLEITGYEPEEFQRNRRLLVDIIHPEDRDRYLSHFFADDTVSAEPIEIRITARDGSIKWLSHVWRPIYIDGIIMGRRISNRDVTVRKHLEAQLYHAQKMEAIGSLTGGIAHDFNNILTAIMGYSLLALSMLPNGSPLRKNIESIRQAGEKASALTRQLLAFSRKQALNMQPVNLCTIVAGMENMIRRLMGAGIELNVCFRTADAWFMGDLTQLDQVLLNLAVNARDAMPRGGLITIVIDAVCVGPDSTKQFQGARPGKYVRMSVADRGEGIPREVLDKIFEPFFTTKAQGKGTGLGLATVYGIIRQHGGHICVESQDGCGTTFRILLPAVKHVIEKQPGSDDEALAGEASNVPAAGNEQPVCARQPGCIDA